MKRVTVAQASAAILSLQDELRRGAELRYAHRLHAVLLVAQGMSCRQVAELFGDVRRTVQYWVARFEAKGLAGLQEEHRRGRPPRLTPQQIAEIHAAFQRAPRDSGLSGTQWDGKTLAAYLARAYGVKLGPRQCRRFLRLWASQMLKQSVLAHQPLPIRHQQ